MPIEKTAKKNPQNYSEEQRQEIFEELWGSDNITVSAQRLGINRELAYAMRKSNWYKEMALDKSIEEEAKVREKLVAKLQEDIGEVVETKIEELLETSPTIDHRVRRYLREVLE